MLVSKKSAITGSCVAFTTAILWAALGVDSLRARIRITGATLWFLFLSRLLLSPLASSIAIALEWEG